MDAPVIADNPVADETPAGTAAREADGPHAAAAERSLRRFAFDPASSPAMMAAFAWNLAGPRR